MCVCASVRVQERREVERKRRQMWKAAGIRHSRRQRQARLGLEEGSGGSLAASRRGHDSGETWSGMPSPLISFAEHT